MHETSIVSTRPVCPVCGSTSTYIQKRGGQLSCKTCGYGVRRRQTVQHECPLCGSKQVYLRRRDGTYACRRCGFGQPAGIKPGYLDDMAALAKTEFKETGNVKCCPVCGRFLIEKLLDGGFTCPKCGFSPDRPLLNPAFIAALPPFREIRPVKEDDHLPPTPLTIHGRSISLVREDGTIWVIVTGGSGPIAGPEPYRIPVYRVTPTSDALTLSDPQTVAEAWAYILLAGRTGRDEFLREFPDRFGGLTPEQVTTLAASGMLDLAALKQVLRSFWGDVPPAEIPCVGYAVMLFELGLLDRVDEELQSVYDEYWKPKTTLEDDGGNQPPAPEIQISFDGGKTRWVYVASHKVRVHVVSRRPGEGWGS